MVVRSQKLSSSKTRLQHLQLATVGTGALKSFLFPVLETGVKALRSE